MTRKDTLLGSIFGNRKISTICSTLLLIGGAFAGESHYKMRIHKNFIKEIIDKNFKVVLERVESSVTKNAFLTEVNANID